MKNDQIKRHEGGSRELAAGNRAAKSIIDFLNLLLKLGYAQGKTTFADLVDEIEKGQVTVLSEFEFGAGGIDGFKFFALRGDQEPELICDVQPTQNLNG